MRLTFGKYEGKQLSEVPEAYLVWLLEHNRKEVARLSALVKEIEQELEFRENEQFVSLSVEEQVIEAGYRALALKAHPDRGGHHEDMVELNATVEGMRRRARSVREDCAIFNGGTNAQGRRS
jgi:hypothetical protein